MEQKTTAKDFFMNLGAIIALSVITGNLIGILFTIINKAYPITTGYNYFGSYSISWPVAALIIFSPVYILLMWFLERDFTIFPDKRYMGLRKWFSYVTLFFAGLTVAIDLVTVLYYFIDGQELTTGFIMKVLSVLVVALAVFFYYITDALGKLNSVSRKVWTGVLSVVILGLIIWGFSVLGSPRTQQLLKYDERKVNDLQQIDNQIQSFYSSHGVLPKDIKEATSVGYSVSETDSQTQKSYEYVKISDTTYNLCAEFNKTLNHPINEPYLYEPATYPYGSGVGNNWIHPAGHYCFNESVRPNNIYPPKPMPGV